jgi:acetyl esterase/lipase
MKKILSLLAIALTLSIAAQQQQQPRVPGGVKAHRDLAYVENGHERQKLDLFLPEKSDAPLPLLIWIHGGGWQAGSKDGCPPLRGSYIEHGYAVASIGYRLSGHAVFPAQIEDCKSAIRWLRAHAKEYNLDPQRFGVWGSSAGGHLVALTGTSGDVKEFDKGANLDQSSRVQAVCDYYGPTDFSVFVTTPGYESHATASSPEAKLIGGAVSENKDKAARVNPISYVSHDDPPFLIVHGDKDPTVPINQSRLLFDALKTAGVSAHFHTIHGAGHGGPGFAGRNIDEMVAAFFDERLKGASAKTEALTTESTTNPALTARDPRVNMPAPGGARRGIPWEAVLGRDDKNKDGKVSKEEFSGPKQLFDLIDANHDGFVTREEHETFLSRSPGARPETSGAQPATPRQPPAAAPQSGAAAKGFHLDGERWAYRDGDFAMDGILLKPEGKGPFPAVLISHGYGGNAQSFGMQKAREMMKWGMVCIAPNYTHAVQPGAQRGGPPPRDAGASAENIRRAKTCVEILRGMPEVDAKHIAAYGHSMGGFVTIGLAADAPGLLNAAAITGSGVAPQDGFPAPSAGAAEKIRTPFLILHGSADSTVRPEQSASLKAVLDRNKVPNERRVFEGENHPIDQTKREEVFAQIRQWFTKQGVLAAAK